ncbi:MAG: hypothetical protein DCF25_21260 [Leptolyngbya foveolarum]|uniref:Outer membrane protein beta-barrel domain-containing protein n=1 Tax=Leptolyngbya foveolarum TaxID=47253 RepID=A0A2W4TY75_9CYAN|nr:MAG: hypothetical protein DCF25_21260 [Leptolyngbya foveolarum]
MLYLISWHTAHNQTISFKAEAEHLLSFPCSLHFIHPGVCSMKINFALLLPLAVLSIGALVSPARANPVGDRATVAPTIVSQRSERTVQNTPARRVVGQPMKDGNYIGLGGSNNGAVVNGKYALSNNFSVRPGVTTSLTNDDGDRGVAVLAPVTYDFNGNGNRRVQPFVGAGAGVTTGDGTNLEVVATAGTDVRLGNRYVLNGSVNYLPLDGQRVDVAAGLGYRF